MPNKIAFLKQFLATQLRISELTFIFYYQVSWNSSKVSEPGFPGSEKFRNRNFPEPGMKKYREIGRSNADSLMGTIFKCVQPTVQSTFGIGVWR